MKKQPTFQELKKLFKQKTIKNFAIVGGASANLYLRKELEKICLKYKSTLHLSDLMYDSVYVIHSTLKVKS